MKPTLPKRRAATSLVPIALISLLLAGCGDSGDSPATPGRGTDGGKPSTAAPGVHAFELVDQTLERGIDFVNDIGITGKRYMPEQLGCGGALFDCDGDGDLDLLLLNGGPIKGSPGPKSNALYLNEDGYFRRQKDIGDLAAPDDFGQGCAVADVEPDGDLDVLITNWGRDRLYLNDGSGRFTVATTCGITSNLWGASAAFGDVNGDGLVDLYITNYVDYDIEKHDPCYQRDIEVYCGPQPFAGQRDYLFLNEGNGTFVDATSRSFARMPTGKGLGVVMADYDHDGDLDIYVANDQTPNNLFQNDGTGKFQDIADLAGVHVSKDGVAEAGMGVAFADYDNDGREDIVVTNFEDQVNSIYRNEGDDFFMEVSWEVGIGYESRPYLGWGVGLVDLDLDGWKDLFFGNGHVYDNAHLINDSVTWKQKNRVHLNSRDGKFRPTADAGVALDVEQVTRGVLFGDIDNDGDVDVIALNVQDRPQLLLNQTSGRHWLAVTTAHPEFGTPLLGARVEIEVGGALQTYTVQGSYSFLTHNDTRVFFGLGDADHVDALRVTWVGGKTESFGPMAANRLVVLTPGKPAAAKDLKTGAVLGTSDAK